MPCYVVQTQSVEFKASNADLIKQMLATNGYKFNHSGSTINVGVAYYETLAIHLDRQEIETTSQSLANEIKRKYSEHILKIAAKKKQWVLKKKANNKFTAKRW